MQSPPPIREVTALLRAITSAEAHAMKQTVFEREEHERQERERIRQARESWRMTPADLEEEKEERRQERAARRKAKQAAAEKAAKESENARVPEAKAEDTGCAETLPTPEPTGSKEPAHPLTPASGGGEGGSSRRLDATSLTPTFSPGEGEDTTADQVHSPVTKDAGGAWQPSVIEEREYAENYMAEEAESLLTPLNAA